ncbi:hypothetical protein Hypma_001582 [Hypsizygus marmoreus]|uniref:Uncharacterized protein n=1 Tax=Hypsizygus marmoreus TaxID=39966 RepID=A0A369JDH8_HYPMA|nr:hypothetical protein Hypma_001582 [Hypsizygus marmoreus]
MPPTQCGQPPHAVSAPGLALKGRSVLIAAGQGSLLRTDDEGQCEAGVAEGVSARNLIPIPCRNFRTHTAPWSTADSYTIEGPETNWLVRNPRTEGTEVLCEE